MKFSIIEILTNIYTKKITINKKYVRHVKYEVTTYFSEIINVLKSTHSWRQYNGLINGRTLNNKHNQFSKLNIYKEAYKYILDKYFKSNKSLKFKYISIDSSFIPNKLCMKKLGRNKYFKNKKGVKISSIVDSFGIPISVLIVNGSENDSKSLFDTFENMFVRTNSDKYKNHNRYKQYVLGDKGYDSKKNNIYLKSKGYHPIIDKNNRNTKNPQKMQYLNKTDKKIYSKRIIVENFYSWIKKYPKIDKLYEKTITSYEGLLFLICIQILYNRKN